MRNVLPIINTVKNTDDKICACFNVQSLGASVPRVERGPLRTPEATSMMTKADSNVHYYQSGFALYPQLATTM